MSASDLYRSRLVSAHDAIDLVKDGDTIVVPVGVGEPPDLLDALSDRRTELHDVVVSQILPLIPHAYLDPETVEHVRHVSYFLGAQTRKGAQEGWIDYRHNYFWETPRLIRDGLFPVDVVFAIASPMESDGTFAVSLGTDYTMAAIEQARAVVLEVNPGVPYTYGGCHVPIEKVTAIVESDRPILQVGLPEIGPVQAAIGAHVAEHIKDGDTLQIGFGAIPDAVVMQLKGKSDLGIHTEMIGDGILTLIETGAVTNLRKNINPGKMQATFALGSRKLYDWMDHNPQLEMQPVDITNNPALVGQNNDMVTINATIEVDLAGQCCSETMGPVPYSGTGGQADFVRAGNFSQGGRSFIVLPSTAKGGSISRIVPMLQQGAHVTTTKNDVNYVVTEFGVAQLRGRTAKERARALIGIAHPDFRDELTEHAKRYGML